MNIFRDFYDLFKYGDNEYSNVIPSSRQGLISPTSSSPAPSVITVFPSTTVLQKNVWPLQAGAKAFFGDPTKVGWLHANTIDVVCPWELHMDKIKLRNILINKKAADSLTRVLNYIWEKAGKSQANIEKLRYDQYSGSYNYRPMRGGSALSMHSFAAAIDWDSDENQQHSQKHLFQDDSLIVQAYEAEGWIWGGRWSPGSIDAMHFQCARVHP